MTIENLLPNVRAVSRLIAAAVALALALGRRREDAAMTQRRLVSEAFDGLAGVRGGPR